MSGGLFGPIVDVVGNEFDALAHPKRTAGKVSDDLVADRDDSIPLSQLVTVYGGFAGADMDIAVQVIMAESGGRTNAYNNRSCGKNLDGTTAHAVGLMQICTVNAGVAGFSKDVKTFTEQMKNPVNNVKAGKAIKDSQGWGAWETYTNGSYRRFKGQNPRVSINHDKNSLTDNTVVDTAKDLTDNAGSIFGAISKVISALFNPSTYFRLGKGVLGGVLLIGGVFTLAFLAGNKASGGKLASTTKKAAVAAAVI